VCDCTGSQRFLCARVIRLCACVLFSDHPPCCRGVGNIFCNKCTKKRVKLPQVEFYKKVRVCADCFEVAIHTVTNAAGDEIPADVREAQITGAVPPPDEEVLAAAVGDDRRYSRSIL
jgi:FYVE zinc finger